MPTPEQDLDTAIANAAAALAAWDTERVNYSDQGRSEQWTTQYQALAATLDVLMKAKQKIGGPFVVRSYGRSV